MTAVNQVGNALTGSTGSGAFVGADTPTFVTGTVTAPSFTANSTSGIIGTTTNDSAAAGSVGQFLSSVVDNGTLVNLTTGDASNVTSISLTAGDWDVWGTIGFLPAATTNITLARGWVSQTSATLPSTPLFATENYGPTGIVVGVQNIVFQTTQLRFSLSGTTTVYLSCDALFSVDILGAFGGIYARRRR